MCGITGIVGPGAKLHALESMLAAQSHRGPDHIGTWIIEHQVALGHNRLSILDLSEAANQPFKSPGGRYTLIFNGEIYNYLELRNRLEAFYTFRTQSDTEVLLYSFIHWGPDCLSLLNGMYAFAIWDQEENSLFAARDRFGVKPFHYSFSGNSLYFSSEIQPLWAAGIRKIPNEKVWGGFFSKGQYGYPNETFWQEIDQLSAGHFMIFQDGRLEIRSWYNFVQNVSMQPLLPPHLEEEHILGLMEDSVKLRFRADVPIGFNLSGGLDSSTLLALVSSVFPNNDQIEAFTFITGDERYDEIFWVKNMLNRKPYPLNICLLTPEEVPELTSYISRLQAEPFGGIPTLAYSKVFQKARQKGVLVLLDGQGSDEAWAGYDYYVTNSDNLVQGVITSPVKPEALNHQVFPQLESNPYPAPFEDRILNMQYRDLFFTKIPRALRFNDRISMAYGTELREPFLDYRLVEYVFSRPLEFKIQNGRQKWLLRKIANRFLGNEIALAPKRPLQTPQREWLGGPLLEWTDSQIKVLLEKTDWFNKNEVLKIWEKYRKGDQDNSFYLWQWINTAELLK